MRFTRAEDFRRSLESRIRTQSELEGGDLERLRKQVAFERLLARLFAGKDVPWMLKGGYALELRLKGRARSTVDLDLNVPPPFQPDLLERLRDAADLDLGDFFSFTLASGKPPLQGPPLGGMRLGVEARLAGRVFVRFALDVGQGDLPLGTPTLLSGQMDFSFADLSPLKIVVYPLTDHFAEKVHAYTRPREMRTRVKDLIDLALLLERVEPNAALKHTLEATFARYATHTLTFPLKTVPPLWHEPFARMAREMVLEPEEVDVWHTRLERFLKNLV